MRPRKSGAPAKYYFTLWGGAPQIGFSATILWNDTDLIEIPLKTSDEPRYLVVGKILEKHWSAIISYRSEKIRIISVRRARKEEVEIYES